LFQALLDELPLWLAQLATWFFPKFRKYCSFEVVEQLAPLAVQKNHWQENMN
jgi:hypothetical protein